ncbi:MAG: DUF3969 family protein [Psychrobacter alimentarius]
MVSKFNPNKLILNILLIGIIRLLHLRRISNDQAHWLIFSPNGLEALEKNQHLNDFSEVVNQALFLEDVLDISGIEKYQKELTRLESEFIEMLVTGDSGEMRNVLEIITSLGIDSD